MVLVVRGRPIRERGARWSGDIESTGKYGVSEGGHSERVYDGIAEY